MKKLIFFFSLLPLVVSAQEKLSEANYRIFSVKQLKEVSLADIAKDMANYDVLFYGEEHNDSVTHFLERSMLELLYADYGADVALSMEMFERDVQPVMNEYLKGFIQEKHFKRDARVWGNYLDYRPMVEFAKEKRLDVVCANAPGRYTNLAGRRGEAALDSLPAASKAFFAPVPYDTATGAYYKKLTDLPAHIPGQTKDTSKMKGAAKDTAKAQMPPGMPPMGNFNMVLAQSLWDATMAYSVAEYRKENKENKKKKVMQVNGRFHSDEKFAAVAQLRKYSPKTRSLIISTDCDTSFPDIKWENYLKMGDYIIITDPKVPKTYDNPPAKEAEHKPDNKGKGKTPPKKEKTGRKPKRS